MGPFVHKRKDDLGINTDLLSRRRFRRGLEQVLSTRRPSGAGVPGAALRGGPDLQGAHGDPSAPPPLSARPAGGPRTRGSGEHPQPMASRVRGKMDGSSFPPIAGGAAAGH